MLFDKRVLWTGLFVSAVGLVANAVFNRLSEGGDEDEDEDEDTGVTGETVESPEPE
jgi:hypothetical protein